MKKNLSFVAMITMIGFIFSLAPVGAYAAGGTTDAPSATPTTSNSLKNLFSPFESFFNSVNSIGNTAVPVSKPSVSVNTVVTGGALKLFSIFDNWLYGVAGFHISNLLTWTLSILSWLLGQVKYWVDYVLNLIQGRNPG
jgi:hypothetical protein